MEKRIDVTYLLKLYLKRWWCIVLAFVIGAVAAGIYTTYFVTPMYTTYGTLYTKNTTEVIENNEDVNLSTLVTRKELVASYAEVLSSKTFLNEVAKEVNLGYSANHILGMLSMTSKNETEILVIMVTSPNPEHSHIIAEKMIEKAPAFVNEVIEGGTVKVLDPPEYDGNPSSPNLMKNVVLGAAVGILFSLVIVLLIEIANNKVKDTEEIADMFKYPILGEIPYYAQNPKEEKSLKKGKTEKAEG